MRLILVVGVLLGSGCAPKSVMMETRGSSRYAPVNERPGGQVRYLLNGPADLVKDRREDAYQQMWSECNGHYRIASEANLDSGSVGISVANVISPTSAVASNGSATMVTRIIDFECVDAPERPEAAPYREPKIKLAPRKAIVDEIIQARIAGQVGCAASAVRIEKAAFMSQSQTAYQATACGGVFSCLDDAGEMKCSNL